MSRDPFEIGKVDAKKALGQGNPLNQLGAQAAQARAGELGSAGQTATPPVAPTTGATPPSDQVQLSAPDTDNDDSRGAAVSNNILAAWGGGQPAAAATDGADAAKTGAVQSAGAAQAANGGFQVSQGPQAGFTSGGVMGPGGMTGSEPGMHAGAVYSTRPNIAA